MDNLDITPQMELSAVAVRVLIDIWGELNE